MTEHSSSLLLELPGELRNRIYRLCLVSEPIVINTAAFQEPPLLHACKNIRKEASTIFYSEDKFKAWVHNYESSPLMAALAKAHIFKVSGRAMHLRIRVFGRPSWRNLQNWLRRRQAVKGGAAPQRLNQSTIPRSESELVQAMMAQVAQLQDMKWETIQALIQPMRTALVAIDQGWADEDVV